MTEEVLESAQPPLTWQTLGLSPALLELVNQAKYSKPTEIQVKTIPPGLDGRDIIASSQTGSGKTASFVFPMVERLAGREGTFGLVLAPTREIAQQIQATIELFGKPLGVRSIVLIGGVNMRQDAEAINSYPQVIVGTPGRICDHLNRGHLWLDFIEMVILDEADRMLDMGFSAQVSQIMAALPKERQTLLFSATIPPPVASLADRILKDPVHVSVGKPLAAAHTVDQQVLWMREDSKRRELLRFLKYEKGSIMIFTRSKDGATNVWRYLHAHGVYDATYIHSDRLQSHREQALAEFKEGKYRILVATDVAGRGIHVEEVAHVLNYDLPIDPESYIHRIGRTGRAGASGRATTFATTRDRGLIREIENMIGRPIRQETIDQDLDRSSGGGRRPPAGGRGRPPRRGGSNSGRRP